MLNVLKSLVSSQTILCIEFVFNCIELLKFSLFHSKSLPLHSLFRHANVIRFNSSGVVGAVLLDWDTSIWKFETIFEHTIVPEFSWNLRLQFFFYFYYFNWSLFRTNNNHQYRNQSLDKFRILLTINFEKRAGARVRER